jgi:DNA-binding transcriptional ArsR family regulator
VQALAEAFDTSAGTIFNIIHDNLSLIKKSARWVPKLLSPDQIEKRVETLAALVQLVQEKGRGILSRIVTMDESVVSMHTL